VAKSRAKRAGKTRAFKKVGKPASADPNGNREQRRAAKKLGIAQTGIKNEQEVPRTHG
jgi:hypothetical protein